VIVQCWAIKNLKQHVADEWTQAICHIHYSSASYAGGVIR
jgi:hypothetical protein